MIKSFIKIKPITGYSEAHNQRIKSPQYLIEKSAENVHIVDQKIDDAFIECQRICKEKTGRKMQAKATPIREAVVLLTNDDNDKNMLKLFALADELKKRYGIETIQTHIHNDEGHIDDEGNKKYNYHAHLVFKWFNKNTGKSPRLDKSQMSDIQTITSEILGMERGVKGSKSLSLTHQEWRGYMKIKDTILEEMKLKELTENQDIEIRKSIIKNRENHGKDKGGNRSGIKR